MTFTHVAEKAAGEWGVLSVAELRGCGLDDEAIGRRVRSGTLARVHRGVYAVGHTGLTMRGWFLAAVKACGEGAVLSHFSAAALWDLLPYDPNRAPDVIARGPRRIPGVNTHRSNKPPPQIRYDRIPVTTPARTLADLSSMLPFKPHRRAVREALARNRITPQEAAALTPDTPAPTRSQIEDLVLDLIAQAGLPAPQVNRPLPNGPHPRLPLARPPAHPRSRRPGLARRPDLTPRRRPSASQARRTGRARAPRDLRAGHEPPRADRRAATPRPQRIAR